MDPIDRAHTNDTTDNDTVVIVDYDTSWPILFEDERARLEPAIAPFARSIEHIGSTAVPDLCAKPIIDLMVTVAPLGAAHQYAAALAGFGYVLRADTPNTQRYAFGKRDAQGKRLVRGYNLHVVRHASVEHRRHIAFRDYLRTHPDECAPTAPSSVALRWRMEVIGMGIRRRRACSSAQLRPSSSHSRNCHRGKLGHRVMVTRKGICYRTRSRFRVLTPGSISPPRRRAAFRPRSGLKRLFSRNNALLAQVPLSRHDSTCAKHSPCP